MTQRVFFRVNRVLILLLFFSFSLKAQPKLVVGIVVDQMRADYIQRYWDNFSEGGFKRLVNGGYVCMNTHYHYVPTYTGPGHASIYTGTSPAIHGIIGNNWYQRDEKKIVYCTEDETVNGVGTNKPSGKMSPRRLLAPTLGDELRMSSQKKSKVIALSLKDRAAILPAGHAANAAYWFDNGIFVSSSWYVNDLPEWVKKFNAGGRTEALLSDDWNLMLPLAQYRSSRPDDEPYEAAFKGENKPVFPHKLKAIAALNGGNNMIRATPFGNTLVKEFAMAAIEGESLGSGQQTDMIALSFSSTDYIGHQFGIDAIETEDTYVRLDRELEEFLKFLDKKFGKDQYLIFLTADHAAVRAPSLLLAEKIPAGHFNTEALLDSLQKRCTSRFGQPLLIAFENQQLYIDHAAVIKAALPLAEVQKLCTEFLLAQPGVLNVFEASVMNGLSANEGVKAKIAAGYFRKRSGDLMVQLNPGWTEHAEKGTTHGAPYVYDTHVPLIFYGAGIKQGRTWQEYSITDIAPSIAALLGISSPGAATGKVIVPLLQKP